MRKWTIFAEDKKNNNPMNSNRNIDKLLRVIFPEVLMEYFDISGWHDAPVKIEVWLDEKTTWNVPITRVELWFHMVLQMRKLFRIFLFVANLFIST